jgi:DNA-binding SARP family transcriptional activator
MAGLELRFLGDFTVRRGGRALPLPPSRKTRALLAYLSLQPRRFRREQLCELLWEIPDDPLGALRWSLSKLRRLVDDGRRVRVLADRNSVAFDSADVSIDVRELRQLAGPRLAASATAQLEAAAARFRGNFLEGLRTRTSTTSTPGASPSGQALRVRIALLAELARTERVAATPEQALSHARALVGLAPYDESTVAPR